MYLCIYLSIYLSVCLSIYLSICLSVCVFLCVFLCFWLNFPELSQHFLRSAAAARRHLAARGQTAAPVEGPQQWDQKPRETLGKPWEKHRTMLVLWDLMGYILRLYQTWLAGKWMNIYEHRP